MKESDLTSMVLAGGFFYLVWKIGMDGIEDVIGFMMGVGR